jgi:hypothetical protein
VEKMGRLIDLLIQNFAPFLNKLWTCTLFWRSTTLIIFLLLGAAWAFRSKLSQLLTKPDRIEHDRQIFTKSEELLTERQLRHFLDQLMTDHSYYVEASLPIDRFCTFFDEVGNHFISQTLQSKSLELVSKLCQLRAFLGTNFWDWPPHQIGNLRLCLHPELNVDRGGSSSVEHTIRYGHYAQQLERHVKAVEEALADYRQAIKRELTL